MTKRLPVLTLGVAVGAAALAGLAAGSGAAEETAVRLLGVAYSHGSVERFDMSVGVTATAAPLRPRRYDEVRDQLNVPSHLGDLVAVTGDAETAILWYRDSIGVLRNAVVGSPNEHLYRIVRTDVSRYEVIEPR